jgi:hypothetical protein
VSELVVFSAGYFECEPCRAPRPCRDNAYMRLREGWISYALLIARDNRPGNYATENTALHINQGRHSRDAFTAVCCAPPATSALILTLFVLLTRRRTFLLILNCARVKFTAAQFVWRSASSILTLESYAMCVFFYLSRSGQTLSWAFTARLRWTWQWANSSVHDEKFNDLCWREKLQCDTNGSEPNKGQQDFLLHFTK